MTEKMRKEPLAYFRESWGSAEALLRLYSSWADDNFERSKTVTRYVELLLDPGAIVDVPDDDEKKTIGRAVGMLRVLRLPLQAGFEMPAMLWIRWALRDAALPLSSKFSLDFSTWLASNDLDTIRYQRYLGELSDSKHGIGAEKKQTNSDWGGPRNRGKFRAPDGYTVMDLLRLESLRDVNQPETGEIGSEVFRYQWKLRQIVRKRRSELIGKVFSGNILKVIKEMQALERGGLPPLIEKKQNEKKKYISNMPKAEFKKMLKKKLYFSKLSDNFLERALSTVLSFPRGRPVKTQEVTLRRRR